MERYNRFENMTMQSIRKIVDALETYQGTNSPIMMKNIMSHSNSNKLFTDACSTSRTPFGNYRRNEFVLHCPQTNIKYRIECKSQQVTNDLIGRIDYELSFVAKMYEDKYCLILEGALCVPSVLKHVADIIKEKRIEHLVWFGTLKQFEAMLKKQMAA